MAAVCGCQVNSLAQVCFQDLMCYIELHFAFKEVEKVYGNL